MARPKKPLDAQRGHATKSYKTEREIAEKNVAVEHKDLLAKTPAALVNNDAKKAWKEWAAYLRDMGFYGNVTLPELIGYCNAWAVNVKAWRKIKKGGLDPDEESAIMKTVKESSEEMTRCMNRGGFSVNSRITLGEAIAKEQANKIDDSFGDI